MLHVLGVVLGIMLGMAALAGSVWLYRKRDGAADEALRSAIEEHQGGDDKEEIAEFRQERAMLRSILDLAEVTVGEVMTHRRNVVMVDADLAPAEIVDDILASPYTRVPLWRNNPDNIISVVHAKPLLRAMRAAGGKIDNFKIETLGSKPWFVPDATTLHDQLQAFRQRHEHFALVVDEYGTLMGVVTLEDILEEIVGDITDELDTSVAGVFTQPDGSIIVDGKVTVRDLNRQFDWELPAEEDYSTIAGLVINEARRIPEMGQNFTFFGFQFEILKRQRHQILTLRVTPPVEEKK